MYSGMNSDLPGWSVSVLLDLLVQNIFNKYQCDTATVLYGADIIGWLYILYRLLFGYWLHSYQHNSRSYIK